MTLLTDHRQHPASFTDIATAAITALSTLSDAAVAAGLRSLASTE